MRNLLLLVLLSCTIHCRVYSQEKIDLKETFLEAENYILYEDYEEALALYQKLEINNCTNAYICHRIGECYLQIPGKKEKAIPYLEEASKNISPKIKEGSFKEKNAPARTLFYLGDAYQVNNQLDKAILTYQKFEKQLDVQDIYNMAYVNQQIQSCNNAKELISNPVEINTTNIGNAINDEYSNEVPVVSSDEQAMVFISKLKFYNAVYYTQKAGGTWIEPINITPQIKSDGDFYPNYLSADKKTMVLTRIEDFTENIYISNFIDGKWQVPVKLNKNINTKFWDSHATLSADGKTLYFVSNRKGGYGGLDIYKSVFNDKDNDWGEAVNLGPEINTPLNEETPKVSEDGQTLYFSSQCHYNMGGFDIFYSKKIDNNNWSTPINIGYPVNTTDDDLFFYPLEDGTSAYASIFDKSGFGQKDIIKIEFHKPEKNIAEVNVRGNVCSLNKDINFDADKLEIHIIDINKKESKIKLVLEGPQFDIKLTPGTYSIILRSKNYKESIKTLIIPSDYARTNLAINFSIDSREEKTNKFFSIK